MRRFWTALLCSASIFAQQAPAPPAANGSRDGPPVRLYRGEVIAMSFSGGAGEISLRDTLYRVHTCDLTGATWIEMNNRRVVPAAIRLTMSAELVAGMRPSAGGCDALTIYLSEALPRWSAARPQVTVPSTSGFLDNLWPRGNLIFTGTVRSAGHSELIVRTRAGEERRMRVRDDTVFSTGGRIVGLADLEPQRRVHVRAGRGYDGALEVYQVTWGDILQPDTAAQTPKSSPNP